MGFSRKLETLGYPMLDKFDFDDSVQVTNLVAWLEDRKIRNYPADQRTPLRTAGPRWKEVFFQYLHDLGCPAHHMGIKSSSSSGDDLTSSRIPACLHWLVSHAVALDFEDGCEEITARYERLHSALPPPYDGQAQSGKATGLSDAANSALIALERCCGIANGVAGTMDVCSRLKAVLSVAELKLSPPVLEAAKKLEKQKQKADVAGSSGTKGKGGGSKGAGAGTGAKGGTAAVRGSNPRVSKKVEVSKAEAALDPSCFPLGFSTGDDVVDRVAVLLRMLYLHDQRQLQRGVNELLTAAQAFTANPKTNAALGQVGR